MSPTKFVKRKNLDLSKPNCHVCGKKLERDFRREKEACRNPKCQLYKIEFNISYITELKQVDEKKEESR